MTTPDEARATFLWSLTGPWEIYRAIASLPHGERGELTRVAADRLGVSTRTVQRRVARYWPPADEPQERGSLHELACKGPSACSCQEVMIGWV
jgi:hypothetical protein